MSYSDFTSRIYEKFGGDVCEVFHEDGKHTAILAGDIRITGNTYSPSVMVSWGSGHTAKATI